MLVQSQAIPYLGLQYHSQHSKPTWFVSAMKPHGCVKTNHLGDSLIRVCIKDMKVAITVTAKELINYSLLNTVNQPKLFDIVTCS